MSQLVRLEGKHTTQNAHCCAVGVHETWSLEEQTITRKPTVPIITFYICMYSRFCACYAMPLYWRVNLGYDVTLDDSSVEYTCRRPAVYWNKSHFYQKTGPLISLSQISIWVVLAMCLTVCLPVILSTEAVTVTVTGKAVRLSNEVVTLDDCSSWE